MLADKTNRVALLDLTQLNYISITITCVEQLHLRFYHHVAGSGGKWRRFDVAQAATLSHIMPQNIWCHIPPLNATKRHVAVKSQMKLFLSTTYM